MQTEMKIVIFVLVTISLTNYVDSQFFSSEDINNNVTIRVNPPTLVEGLATQVDIECTFNRDNVPSMASVMFMMLGHSVKTDQPVFNYLASVNGMEGHAHNVSHDVDVISGYIDNIGESKLHVRFMYPETHLTGLYKCEVTGFDQIGKPVAIYSTISLVTYNITDLVYAVHSAKSNITNLADELLSAKSNITHLLDALQSAKSNITNLADELHNATSNITHLANALYSATSNITHLADALHNAQSNISDLENVVNRKQECIDIQANYTDSLHKLHSTFCSNYYPPIFYNGHVYYLSYSLSNYDYPEMQSKCGVIGGYLIELDSHEEFNFFRDYIGKQLNKIYDGIVLAGATDEKQEGVWINGHNLTSRPDFDWGYDQPNGGRAANCQCFDARHQWNLIDCVCSFRVTNSLYMCEIPRVIC